MADANALDVLIVDDHEAMRTLLRKVLERAGVRSVRDAADGAVGLAMLGERAPNLILVDQNMPRMDGATFVARVRADGLAARIIMITGRGDAATAEAARSAGADAVLVKPVMPSALLEAIERILATSPAQSD